MILYLDNKNIKEEVNFEINKIAKNNMLNFSNFISEISKMNQGNIDWHLSLPLSRNTITSDFFYNICKLIYIKKILEIKQVNQIVVDDYMLKKNIEKIFVNEKIKISYTNKNTLPFFKVIKIFLFFFYKFIIKFLQIYICKFTSKKKNPPNKKIILIEKFVSLDLLKKDRYYGNLLKYVNNIEKNKIYFIPFVVLTNIKSIYKTYKKLREQKKYIIKEDYFTFFDLLYSSLHCFRLFFLNYSQIKYQDMDVSNLFKGELISHRGCDLAIEGILNYIFFKKIKKNNFKLDLVIDWWENQSCDKGFSLGVKKFYNKTSFVGYLGYIPRDMELHLLPTEYEVQSFLVPNKISVIGLGFKETIKLFNKNLDTIVSPAFRYEYLWNESKKNIYLNKSFKIFIILPIILEDCINIINMLLKFRTSNDNIYDYYIKFHPTMNIKLIKYLKSLVGNKFNDQSNNFNLSKWFIYSNLIITSHSSAGLEAVCNGIPVIIIQNKNGLHYNPIPKEIQNLYSNQCYNYEDLKKNINYIFNNFKNIDLNRDDLKRKYFEKSNNQNTNYFFIQCM